MAWLHTTLACVLACLSLQPGQAGRPAIPQAEAAARHAIFVAEDGRAPTPEALEVLAAGTRHNLPAIQQLAVRALGRLERPELADRIASMLAASSALVRAEAANALGQAVSRSGEHAPAAMARLLDRLAAEQDPAVRGVICETVGRLPYTAAGDVQRAESALYDATWRGSLRPPPGSADQLVDPAPLATLTGAAKGLEVLIRLRGKVAKPSRQTLDRLLAFAVTPMRNATGGVDPDAAFVRRVVVAALGAARFSGEGALEAILADADPQVRRLAIAGLAGVDPSNARTTSLVQKALADPAPIVRYEALRAFARRLPATSCAPMITAVRDANPHVALLALDLLGGACPALDNAALLLGSAADEVAGAGRSTRAWHRPAHTLAALARIDKESAARRLPAFASHPIWQVRMYAARAAAVVGDGDALRQLAADPNDNVREAAVSGLSRLVAHGADAVYLAALERRDYQLIMTAARALGGTPGRDAAAAALMAALDRLTAENRDTSRDPRVAILERLREIGSAGNAAALASYVRDRDPRVARLAAEALTAWTGQPHAPVTTVMRPSPPPTPQDLRDIDDLIARVTVRGLGTFEMALLSGDAPASVTRFVRLARAGHYDGLTFHRVVPNFLIQGGSPGANEYAGDGAYMRDELGLRSNRRGTVGISTRGRDTGDAQIYINLVDNLRLDHDYAVFAEIIAGIDVTDEVLEGDVIERIEIIGGGGAGR